MMRTSCYHLVGFQLSRVLRYAEANILNTGTLPPANPREEHKVNIQDAQEYQAKLDSSARLQHNMLAGEPSDDSLAKKDERRNSILGTTEELSRTIREYKSHENQKIVESLMAAKSADTIYYRDHPHPWELLVKPRRHRVADMIGVLMNEHRVEIEHIIWKICDLCELDFYFVLVPTVGNVKPRVFAESLFTQWEVGTPIQQFVQGIVTEDAKDVKSTSEPSKPQPLKWHPRKRSLARGGNGVLLVLAQQEAMIELVTSYAIAKYFNERMINLVVKEILQPLLVSGKDPSYAILQVVYAIARHSDEFKYKWRPYFYPIITLQHKNEVLFLQHTMYYGVYMKTPIFTLTFLFVLFTLWMLRKIRELRCEECGTMMKRVVLPRSYYDENEKIPELDELPKREENRKQFLQRLFSIYGDALTAGQKVEMEHECADYRVFHCAKCDTKKARLVCREFHNYTNCMPCEKCHYHTVSERKEILRLPTKTEDGVKQFDYRCKHCDWEKMIYLPLFHPLELHPKKWYDVLLQRSAHPNAKSDVKMF